jgi:four helix bundle protein
MAKPTGTNTLKFEDLEVWKRATNLSADIYRELGGLKDFSFRDQITRSGLSIPSNIAEGFEREAHSEAIPFLSYAKGSCGELRTQIHIGSQIGYIPAGKAKEWLNEATEISSMIKALIKTKRRFIREPF